MPQLLVDRLHCLSDTDRWADDRICLLLVVAGQGGRCRLRAYHHAPQGWQDLADGARCPERFIADPDWTPDSIVLAALFERDGDSDLAAGTGLPALLERMEGVRRLFASLPQQPRVFLAVELLTAFDQALHAAIRDDRLLGHAQLVEPSTDPALELAFAGHGGHYRLRFVLQ